MSDSATEPILRIAEAADKAAEARANLEIAIRFGRKAGLSLRSIAAVSGFSVETVRQISQKERNP